MACDPSTKEVESGGPDFQGHPWVYSIFEAMLGYKRFCLKKKYNKKTPDMWGSFRTFCSLLSDIYTEDCWAGQQLRA